MLGADEFFSSPPLYNCSVFGFDIGYHDCENKQGDHSFLLAVPV